jgi:hypothetical protein
MSHSILNFLKIRKIKAASDLDSGRRQAQPDSPDSRGRRLAALRLIFDHRYSIETKNLLGRPGRLRSLVRQTKKPGLFVGAGLLRLLGHGQLSHYFPIGSQLLRIAYSINGVNARGYSTQTFLCSLNAVRKASDSRDMICKF